MKFSQRGFLSPPLAPSPPAHAHFAEIRSDFLRGDEADHQRADTLTRHVENVALMDEAQDPFAGAEVLPAYTRKDALADGVESDVSEIARDAGLKFPVYLTRAVWESDVFVPDGVRCQDAKGRLWDIVWILRCAARRTSGPQMLFGLHVRNDHRDRTPPLVNLNLNPAVES